MTEKMTAEMTATSKFAEFFKLATGIDILSRDVVEVTPSLITISETWEQECLEQVGAKNLEGEARVFFGLISMGRAPSVSKSQPERCIIKEGAVLYRDAASQG
jgi:hypothetical protein